MGIITVRRPSFDLADLPGRWVGDSRLGTWFGNAGHVFIPLGEEMFIDAVKAFRDQVSDPELRRSVTAFIGQEAVHARVHRSVWDELRAHGVPVDTYGKVIEGLRTALEPHVPPTLLLSITAALEHYTAVFGAAFLEEDLDAVLPAGMADLLRWHGAEELEHRSVAFDVLREVDDDPALRAAGMVVATALFTAVPVAGVVVFGVAEMRRSGPLAALARPSIPDPRLLAMGVRLGIRMAGEVARYLRPGFHPDAHPLPASYDRWVASSEDPT